MKIFPVAIFAYNRPYHLQQLLNSLMENYLSSETDVTIFIDKFNDTEIHNEVVKIAKEERGFKSSSIVIQETNIGLKSHLKYGINKTFENNNAVIILEDDLVLDKYFLEFMNKSLNMYEKEKRIFHINGWSYPQISFRQKQNIIGKLAAPWGWGTWKDRWQDFEINYTNSDLINGENQDTIDNFNFYNLANFSRQLIANSNEEISTLDIFWYQYIFVKKGLTVFPEKSLVSNSGFDGSGMHCGISDKYEYNLTNKPLKKYSNNLNIDKLNNISTYYFYLKLKIKDYLSYHSKKIISRFVSS